MAPDGLGGAFAAWTQATQPDQVYLTHVGPTGQLLWPVPLHVAPSSKFQSGPILAPDGQGGVFVLWVENYTSGALSEVRVSRITGDGTAASGWPLFRTVFEGSIYHVCGAVPDDAGGVMFLWTSYWAGPSFATDGGLYAQRIDAAGTLLWGTAGLEIRAPDNSLEPARVVGDGSGGIIAAWSEDRFGSYDIFAQRVSSAGTALWTAGGAPVCAAAGTQSRVALSADGTGGAIVAWTDQRVPNPSGFPPRTIYAQALDPAGAPRWTADGLALSAPGELGGVSGPSVSFAADVITVAWSDASNDVGYDFLALGGERVFGPTGSMLCAATGASAEHSPGLVPGIGREVLVAWVGSRGCFSKTNSTRLDALSPTTAVALVLVSSEVEGGRVRLAWHAPGDAIASASLSRRTPETDWALVAELQPDPGRHLSYEDSDVAPGTRYGYRLVVRDLRGDESVDEQWVTVPSGEGAPSTLRLEVGGANPSGGRVELRYGVPVTGHVRLVVYDIRGRMVATVADRQQPLGWYTVLWDGRDAAGWLAASGCYFVRLENSGTARVQKVLLMR
jgi:hypothetical protein